MPSTMNNKMYSPHDNDLQSSSFGSSTSMQYEELACSLIAPLYDKHFRRKLSRTSSHAPNAAGFVDKLEEVSTATTDSKDMTCPFRYLPFGTTTVEYDLSILYMGHRYVGI
ncbi:hypothetical protein CC77DRAFT_1069753 [Alternaria alternata]|uniref:Uncharacterized protein n=1 Tax=Alternaria alternata TaxID=5599 RepID=A0A177E4Z5_ALTAL|nr:hypothetical protein CC77DRAFT_1069753 [Alternaria alternata]OAG26551.1 hypothetical protein CC77DRAFT_1069753 [Alternaria alternata]